MPQLVDFYMYFINLTAIALLVLHMEFNMM